MGLYMRKLVSFFAGFFMLATVSQAQKITGVIKDPQGKGLEKATVSLLRAKDSSVVKLSVTGSNGAYSVNAESGRYLVSASYVGYAPTYSPVFDVNGETKVPDVTMKAAGGSLATVTVNAQKPMIEVRADKTIVNVENTINAVG